MSSHPLHAHPLRSLFTDTGARSRRASSWDRSGGNWDFLVVQSGETVTLLEHDGPGCVVHVYCALAFPELTDYRDAILRCYWDGEASPSVEVPLGDFFGVAHGRIRLLRSALVAVNPGFGASHRLHAYFPMPFPTRARLTLEHRGDRALGGALPAPCYHIDYETYDAPPPRATLRFHAHWRQERPTVAVGPHPNVQLHGGINLDGADNYVALEASGAGQMIGLQLEINNVAGGWYGEGDDMVFVDGDGANTLHRTLLDPGAGGRRSGKETKGLPGSIACLTSAPGSGGNAAEKRQAHGAFGDFGLGPEAREGGRDAHGRLGAGVHPLQVGAQDGIVPQQASLVGPVERIGRHEIDDARVRADDELASFHVTRQDRRHLDELAARDRDVGGEALLLGIEIRVPRDAPERLLELGRGEEQPPKGLSSRCQRARQQTLLRVLLGQVHHGGHRFGEDDVAVHQHGDLGGRVQREELRLVMVASNEIHSGGFEGNAQLLQRPADADRAGRGKLVQSHCLPPLLRVAWADPISTSLWAGSEVRPEEQDAVRVPRRHVPVDVHAAHAVVRRVGVDDVGPVEEPVVERLPDREAAGEEGVDGTDRVARGTRRAGGDPLGVHRNELPHVSSHPRQSGSRGGRGREAHAPAGRRPARRRPGRARSGA